MFKNIYKGKTVLVTGHTGFKGSWLCLWLSSMGAKVVGYSKDIPTEPSHFLLQKLKITSIIGDTLDKNKVLEVIKKYKPAIVFHLAAQPIVRLSYNIPVETFETNIMGAINVLEACRMVKSVKAIVVITSDKCYENTEQIWGYNEDDHMGGDDPYSASKGCVELVSMAYLRSYFHPEKYENEHSTLLATVRAGNVIGGGDWAKDRLIPDMMRSASRKETVTLRSPNATRPWQHVLEPLSGYLHLGWKLLEGKKEFSDKYNFGPSESATITVEEVVGHAKKYWSQVKFRFEKDSANLHEATLLKLDSTKARTKLKWRNVWDSYKTFEKTALWYKNFYTKKKILSKQDLNDYIADAKKMKVEWAVSK